MRALRKILLSAVLLGAVVFPQLVFAQTPAASPAATPAATPTPLTVFTNFPAQVIGIGETVTLGLKVRASTPGAVALSVEGAPADWGVSFRGGGRIVSSVFADGQADAAVDLRVEPPADAASGVYTLTVVAASAAETARLPIELTVQEKLPPKLTLSTELPTLRSKPGSTFRWNVALKNEGDVDLTANIAADAPAGFDVSFSLNGQDVTSVPLAAGESKSISVAAASLSSVPAGDYPITIHAQGADAAADLPLNAQVVGTAQLSLTTPDSRLSGEATAGQGTPFKLVVANTGTAPARGVALTGSAPSGWNVTLDPKQIDELAPGQQVEVTANLQPAEKSLTGDYVVSISAQPADGTTQKVDLRITVTTSNLWGIVGIALIAVAVGVVALAVSRFGRR